MILIDSVYIHTDGGKTVLNTLLDTIIKSKLSHNFYLLCDTRICLEKISVFQNKFIKKGELSRRKFYKKNIALFDKVLCLANVPPPIKVNNQVHIYFHNELIINPFKAKISLVNKFIFILKKYYLITFKNNYFWLVQTNHMKKGLVNILNINELLISKVPIFEDFLQKNIHTNPNTFLYPTSSHKHKNNEYLVKAFINAANKSSEDISLSLTVNRNELPWLKRLNLPSNLKLNFIGRVSHKKLLIFYSKNKYLIFPSLKESFGLPLIEGVQSGCYILASDLDYTNEVINASLLFNPNSIEEITNSILHALQNKNIKLPKVKAQNSTKLILNTLLDV